MVDGGGSLFSTKARDSYLSHARPHITTDPTGRKLRETFVIGEKLQGRRDRGGDHMVRCKGLGVKN